MCNCIEKYNEILAERSGDPGAGLELRYFVTREKDIERKLSINYFYREKKKDGTFHINKKRGTVACKYCPFCGEEILEKGERRKEE